MSFDWTTYLVLAKELASKTTEENQRSAISRAYYAVFGFTVRHLRNRGFVFPATGEVHTLVWQKLQNSRRDCKRLGIIGDRLRKRRTKADYDDEVPNLPKKQKAQLRRRTTFLKTSNVLAQIVREGGYALLPSSASKIGLPLRSERAFSNMCALHDSRSTVHKTNHRSTRSDNRSKLRSRSRRT